MFKSNFRSSFSVLFFILAWTGHTQQSPNRSTVYVDGKGIMRWEHNEKEVHGFGVNYSTPFAHAYRSAQKKGLNIKAEIDKDVYHFTRLGFDLYRLHVWDTEISDEEGNLLENEHLETFDYLLKQLKDRGINFIITPIAYWGNGWPEPDEDTPGFSNKYGKEKSLTNPEAIKAQQNYLAQFLNHVNPYTGIAYKDEPNLIAFEISNEPHHREPPQEVKRFINKMVSAMRSTGSKKPIFYNVSHSVHLAETYFDSKIQGGTFQWYPTGLGFQQELEGNLLPNVNDYNIPFNEVIEENNAAKLVYEFDAADVNKAYMYPAMARSFREAGIQLATHFAYDPSFLAYANTEYNTHYMNLNYTPSKALGLMIASEIFHKVELGKDLGTYPENLEFGDFSISYKGDLASYNSGEKFIYTNSNTIKPKNISELKLIAGHGNSEIIKYEGKGAYFLDKLEEGVWRLEVLPDPILIRNPFGRNSLEKTVSLISWKSNRMELNLQDLGADFHITGMNEGNDFNATANTKVFKISPGTYLLSSAGNFDPSSFKNHLNFELDRFETVPNTVDGTYLIHDPLKRTDGEAPLKIKVTAVSNEEIDKIEAWFRNGNIYEAIELEQLNNYDYSAQVPQYLMQSGFLSYRLIVTTEAQKYTFPGGVKGSPSDWDFYSKEEFVTRIETEDSPVYLFDADSDSEKVVREWAPRNNIIPVNGNGTEFQIRLDKLFEEDPENQDADPIYDYSFRYNFKERIGERSLNNKNELVIEARTLNQNEDKLQVALLMDNGAAFGKTIQLTPNIKEIAIDIKDLEPVRTITLPRPYPGFLPYYFDHNYKGDLKIENVESIQFSIGPGIENANLQKPHEIGIRSVRLE